MKSIVKISQQTFWQILGKIVTSVSTFLILGMVTRKFGEEGTGIFTLALTYLAIFYLLTDFGFNGHVLKQVTRFADSARQAGDRLPASPTQRDEQVTGQWQRLLGTRLIWATVLMAVALITLPFWPFATRLFSQAVLAGSLAILGSGVFITCNLVFQSKLRYDYSVLASSFGTILTTLLVWYLLSNNFYLPSVLTAYMVGWLTIALTSLILVKKTIKDIFPKFDLSYSFNLFKSSWPIAATLALNVIYFRADTFIISYFRSNSEVGIYNIAYSVFQSVLVLPTFIMNAYYPLMLKSLSGIKLIALGLLILASFSTVAVIFSSPFIIMLLTGGGFEGSSQSLQILSLGFPAYFLSSLFMWIMVAKGVYKEMFLIYAIGLLTNLTLNFLFIPRHSYLAASWITVISEYLILMLQIVTLRGGR